MHSQYTRTVPPRFRRQALRQMVRAAWGAGLTAAALAPATSAWAQATAEASAAAQAAKPAADAASSGGVGTVYVTARKRAELQLDVPISVQTMSDKDLRAAGTTSVTELGATAGFSFTSAQSTGAYGRAAGMVTFRGLQGELGRPSDASGGVFVDGIAITGGISTLGMSDVARVEVLKGPQNAFFGRSTFGGAVNFITKNPASELRGTVNASMNHRGSSDVDASIEGPLVEGLLNGRITVASHNKVAESRATDGGALGAENSKSVGGALYFTPTDKLWVRLRGNFQSNDDSLPAVAYLAATGNTSCAGKTFSGQNKTGETVQYTPGTAYFCGSIPSLTTLGSSAINANTSIPAAAYNGFVNNTVNDPYLAKSPKLDHMGMRSEVTQASMQLGYQLPKSMDLAVNLGYNKAYTTSIFDLDKTGTANFYTAQITPTEDLTIDARLSTDASASLRGVVGVSHFKSSYVYSQLDYSPGFGGTTVGISSNFSNFDSDVPAIYGSLEYDFTKQITGSFETRYQRDKITSRTRAGVALENESSNWLPRMTLRYKPTANISMYANLAEGVQPLTVNGGYTSASAAGKALLATLVPGVNDFTPQPKLTSMEFGLKQRVSRDWQYAVAVYDQKWKNRLTGTSVFNPSSCGTTTGTTDCPLTASGAGIQAGNDARIRGIELSVDAQLGAQWSANAYVDYKRAKWTRYDASSQSVYGSYGVLALTGTAVSFDGNTLARVPDLQMSLNSTYRFSLNNGWKSFVRGDVTYVGKMWESDFNFAKTDGYSRFDVRWGFEKGSMSFDLFVKNLANDRSWTTVSRVPNLGISPLTSFANQGLTAIAQEARSVGVRASYSF
ncbi:TonB-dependent receptor [Aquabacterium sp. OR-4]|uniref:TonB-dependent receptor n=1 Tax=Aquabacterium sp. OR-4 TaxID=2978127 RepID=UPI0028C78136|nr:TonB-dependent receptor [Aquabacterium sp. OR-4]MDT7836956.1 TonB-dependent receptor [Aquabacterium sp. OR-4]